MDSVLGLLADPVTARMTGRYEAFSAGAHLAQARNQVAGQFLSEGPQTWLWMLDTDIVAGPGLLTRLAATADAKARPLVSGLYLTTAGGPAGGGFPLVPMLYDRDPDPAPGQPEFTPLAEKAWQSGEVIKAGGCGAGCLLIHRRVLEAIERMTAGEGGPSCSWFTEITGNGRFYGEDLSFCIRAAKAGFAVHADTGARAGHVKPVTLGLPC